MFIEFAMGTAPYQLRAHTAYLNPILNCLIPAN
jgi:hypothetical protein